MLNPSKQETLSNKDMSINCGPLLPLQMSFVAGYTSLVRILFGAIIMYGL